MLRKHKRLTKKELKKDPLVIITAQVVDVLRAEWLKISSTILVVIVVVGLAFLIVSGKKRGAINAYDAALTALSNNSPEALDLLKRVTEDYSGSRSSASALIQLGNSYFQIKDYDSSEKYFNQYIKKFSSDPVYTFNAYNGLAGIYEEKGEFLKAGEMYEQYITKNKLSSFLPMMHLNAGKAYHQGGNKEAAKQNFMTLIENYSDSREKQEAIFFLEIMN